MHRSSCFRWIKSAASLILVLLSVSAAWAAGPSAGALAGFQTYVAKVEARLAQEHSSDTTFLAPVDRARLRRGDLVIDQLTPDGGDDLPGALLHDWRGTAFIPGATATEFERLMKDFAAYPRIYAPQVVSTRVTAHQGDEYEVTMRVRQQHVITVVMDTAYDVRFVQPDAEDGYSISRSTRVDEIASAGSRNEHALSPADGHGFLWRMNTYWGYEQRDGGLYIQVESVSLSRSIPMGLGWAVGPFIESIPHDSLEFTLQATVKALRR